MSEHALGILYEVDASDQVDSVPSLQDVSLQDAMQAIRAAKMLHPAYRNREHLIDGAQAPQADVIELKRKSD